MKIRLLFFAVLLDLLGLDASCLVIGIDCQLSDAARTLRHPRIRLIEGSSTAPETLASIERARCYAKAFMREREWKGKRLSTFTPCAVIELSGMCLREFRSTS